MTRPPVVNFKTMDNVLRRLGFLAVRQKGSHVFYRHTDGRTTTSRIIEGVTWLYLWSVKSCGKLN